MRASPGEVRQRLLLQLPEAEAGTGEHRRECTFGAQAGSHVSSPSVRSLQSAMLPPLASLDGASPLPMAGGSPEDDLRTQSARLGGLRVPGVDPQAHRGVQSA